MKYAVLFSVLFFFSFSYGVSAYTVYAPIPDVPITHWKVTYSTDNDFNVNIDNEFSPSTSICLVKDTVKAGELGTTKNVYDKAGRTIATKTLSEQTFAGVTAKKYGYCFTTTSEKYLRFGEASTVIEWVNDTGGTAFHGLSTDITLNNPRLLWTTYTSAQKDIVSSYDADSVTKTGYNTPGGRVCSDLLLYSSCTGLTISTCPNAIQITSSAITPCLWVGAPVNACVAGGQPCNTRPMHAFSFNASKTNAVNMTVFVGLISTKTIPPFTQTIKLFLFNYTNNDPNTGWKEVGSMACANGVWCNFTYSTTNIKDYMNSSGFVNASIISQDIFTLAAKYAELKVDYYDTYLFARLFEKGNTVTAVNMSNLSDIRILNKMSENKYVIFAKNQSESNQVYFVLKNWLLSRNFLFKLL